MTSKALADSVVYLAAKSSALPLGRSGYTAIRIITFNTPWIPEVDFAASAFDGVALGAQADLRQDLRWSRRSPGESEWRFAGNGRIMVDLELEPGESAEYRLENHWDVEYPLYSQPIIVTRSLAQPPTRIGVASVIAKHDSHTETARSIIVDGNPWIDPSNSGIVVGRESLARVIIEPRLPDGAGTYPIGGGSGRSVLVDLASIDRCTNGELTVRESVTRADGQLHSADMTLNCTEPVLRAEIHVGAKLPWTPLSIPWPEFEDASATSYSSAQFLNGPIASSTSQDQHVGEIEIEPGREVANSGLRSGSRFRQWAV